MPSHQLAAILLATAVWTIFAVGIAYWTPPPGSGMQLATNANGPVHPAMVRTASGLKVHR